MRRTSAAPLVVVVALMSALACADESGDDLDTRPLGPQAYTDHWHTAFGIYVCDEFLPAIPESNSPVGIHTHGDGVVHIHPFSEEGAGRKATLDHFLDASDITLESDRLEVGGERYDECDGEPGEVQIAWWDSADAIDEPPTVETGDGGELRFATDQQAFTIAFVPEGTDIPPPPTTEDLDALGDIDGPSQSTDPGDTTTTLPSGSTSTISPGEMMDPGALEALDDGFYPVQASFPDSDPACAVPGMLASDDGHCYLVFPTGLGSDIVESAVADNIVGTPQVSLVLTDDGIEQFNEMAARCYARDATCPEGQIAIVVDGEVVSAPSVQQASFERDQISITGDFTSDEADEIADTLDP